MGSGYFGEGSVERHVAAADPHGDRAYSDAALADAIAALNLQTFLPTYTWATLPSAAANNGLRVHVSDVGEGGSDWKSNGTLWLPVNGSVLLARSAVAASVTGTTSETALATVTIPAGVMGLNGQLRITTLWTVANNANGKTVRVRFGGGTGIAYLNAGLAGVRTYHNVTIIRNANAANSQKAGPTLTNSFGSSGNDVSTSTVNTAAAFTIPITGTLAFAADSITLESYSVELLR